MLPHDGVVVVVVEHTPQDNRQFSAIQPGFLSHSPTPCQYAQFVLLSVQASTAASRSISMLLFAFIGARACKRACPVVPSHSPAAQVSFRGLASAIAVGSCSSTKQQAAFMTCSYARLSDDKVVANPSGET
jgi:hypothetical protein